MLGFGVVVVLSVGFRVSLVPFLPPSIPDFFAPSLGSSWNCPVIAGPTAEQATWGFIRYIIMLAAAKAGGLISCHNGVCCVAKNRSEASTETPGEFLL